MYGIGRESEARMTKFHDHERDEITLADVSRITI
jgi:hypothetical protein